MRFGPQNIKYVQELQFSCSNRKLSKFFMWLVTFDVVELV